MILTNQICHTKGVDECSKRAYIYALGDPRTGEIYYIGSTIDPYARWSAHSGSNPSGGRKLTARHKELHRVGLRPVFLRLHTVALQDQFTKEFETHREFKASGYALLNRNKSYFTKEIECCILNKLERR